MIIQGFEIYYEAACMIMVCSSLFCAMVRYFHMCRPFDEHEEYFYPARKLITFVYACFAMPAVWLFRMDSPDAWLFVQVFLVLFLPGAAVISFRRFFFYEKKHRLPVFFIVGIMPFLLIAALWAFAWIGGDVLYRHRGILMPFIGAYSLLIMFELLHVTLRLYRQIRKHHREEYSNDDDFPVRFAGFVVFLSLVYIIASWIVLGLCVLYALFQMVMLIKVTKRAKASSLQATSSTSWWAKLLSEEKWSSGSIALSSGRSSKPTPLGLSSTKSRMSLMAMSFAPIFCLQGKSRAVALLALRACAKT